MRRYDSGPPPNVKGGALALVSALFLTFTSPALAAECPATGDTAATIAAVTDGATLRLADGNIVRLAGMEAPPRPLRLAVDAPWPAADSARKALESLVPDATLRLAGAGENPDRYGRHPVYAFLSDGSLLQERLLRLGFGRARWEPGEEGCFSRFLAAEGIARRHRVGLWAEPEYGVRSGFDPSLRDRNGLYDLVEGRVASVGHGTRMIFLDFGHDFRRDFTIMVPPDVADALALAGRPADSLAGRRVRVRGIIEESGGPAIRLNDPAEIELLDEHADDGD